METVEHRNFTQLFDLKNRFSMKNLTEKKMKIGTWPKDSPKSDYSMAVQDLLILVRKRSG